MGGGLFRNLRLCFVALYALTTLVAAFLVSAHAGHSNGAGISEPLPIAGPICGGPQDRAGKASLAAVCCDICDSSVSAGLEPPPIATFLARREIATRLNFALRLGRVADEAPDDLRSRAPPRAA